MENNGFKDQMTPKERTEALREGRPLDRISCNAFIGEHAAKISGIKVSEYHHSAEKMAQAQITAYRTYGSDTVVVGPGLTGISEALGSKVGYPEGSTPFIEDYAVKDFSDLDRLAITNPHKDGRLPIVLEALEILAAELGDEVPVSAGLTGPFSNAANLRGTEQFLRDLYYNPEFAHKLLRLTLDCTISFLREAAKLGVSFGIADPTASGSLISPRLFREFAFPYLKELTAAITGTGAPPPQLHICGNTKKIWQAMADTGAGALSLDNVIDLAEAKQAVGDRVVLVGNIRPAETMLLGAPSDVIENAKDNLRRTYDNPKGYILALGCGLPIDTPPENIHALLRAARKYGRYPLNPELFGPAGKSGDQ